MNVIKRIAWKNLKRNKKRTTTTMIGIIVAVALISFIFTLLYSFQDSMIESTKRNRGNYHIYIDQATAEEAIKWNQMQDKIEIVGISQTIGAADYKTQIYAKQGIRIEAYDELSLQNRDIRLVEGRLPQNEKEILISSYLSSNLNKPVKVGDKLTLDVQKVKLVISKDGKEESLEPDGVEQVTYTVVGIMKQTRQEASSTNAYIAITKLEQMTKVRPCQVTLLLKNPKEVSTFYQELRNTRVKDHLSENQELLLWQGATTNEMNEKSQIEIMGIIAILIVVGITIVLVQNSFQISISERRKEFGTLVSIGATSKQIKKMVLMEGMLYAVIGIPSGFILGIGGVFFSTKAIGIVLAQILGNDWTMQCNINGFSILATIFLVVISILLSCRKPVKQAQKASPIEAIKQNDEIAIANQEMKIRSWKAKMLGIEGEIAYKNNKRNKRKYRSTTISITIIMILVMTVSSMISYLFSIINDVYHPINRNIDVGMIYGQDQEQTSTVFENFDRIKQLDSIIDYSIIVRFEGTRKENNQRIIIMAYEGGIYENYLESLGKSSKDTIGAGILLSKNPSIKEGETLKLVIKEKEYQIPIIKTTNLDPDWGIQVMDKEKIEKLEEKKVGSNDETLIISNEMAKSMEIDDKRNSARWGGGFFMDMKINSNNPNKLEKEIAQFVNLDKMAITNYTKQKEDAQRLLVMMNVFLYGLLFVISLIGITNIDNTITASISLRKREFEILRTIGMSNKQFNKMFLFESLLYGGKALTIAIALGTILNYSIYHIIKTNQGISYYFPFVQMGIMIVLTILVIHKSTKAAWQKLK